MVLRILAFLGHDLCILLLNGALQRLSKRLDIRVVQSVDECLAFLSKIDGFSRAKPDIVSRLMVRFGLKEQALG